jgi:RNase P/RNase MRP subunit POP5
MLLIELVVAISLVVSLVSLYLGFGSWLKTRKAVAVIKGILNTRSTKMVRPRRRYLVFEIIAVSGSLPHVRKPDIEGALESSCRLLYGVLGYSIIRPTIIYYDESRGVGILSFKHNWRNHVFLLLSLTREVGGVKVVVVPRATTGTRRKAMDYVRRA